MTSQYETNFWSTHVNIVRLAEPMRGCVAGERRFSKSRGLSAGVSFLPSPPPLPSFTFWLSFHFSRGQNRKSPSSLFLRSETKRKRLLRRLRLCMRNKLVIVLTKAAPAFFILWSVEYLLKWNFVQGMTIIFQTLFFLSERLCYLNKSGKCKVEVL